MQTPVPIRAFLALAPFILMQPMMARAGDVPRERAIIVATAIGGRMFASDLQLNDDFCFGGRAGIGLGQRWSLLLDFIASHPHREVTAVAAYVDALRFLARVNLRTGKFRPYVVGGIGGVLFMFNDSPTTAGGTLTAGLGGNLRVAPQTALFLEGSVDFYAQQEITYDRFGDVSFAGRDHAKKLGTVTTGIEVQF